MPARFISLFIMAFMCVTLGVSDAWAAKIKNVKGKKVLVDLEGETVEPGQIFYVVKDGKNTGLIKISKVKNNQGLAILGKGKAEVGSNIKLREKKGSDSGSSPSRASRSGSGPQGESFFGGMGGFNMASADVKLPLSGNTVSLSGSGFSAKGLFDYKVLDSIWFRGMGGLEQFIVGGANDSLNCGGECKVEISYISFDLWGRFLLSTGNFRPWIGGGGGLLFPMSKKSTAIQKKSITNTNIFAIGGGIDWFLSPTTYLPIQVEYDLYPSSSTVKATALTVRAGFAVPW
jgi:hypothetical protein